MTTTPRATRALHALAAFALFVLAAGLTDVTRDRALRARDGWPPEADALYLPPADFLRRVSLGHTELAADLVAARTLVYFGTQLVTKGKQRWLGRYLGTVSDLDPFFQAMYERGGTMLVYDGNPMTLDSFEAANAYLRRGLQSFPNDWKLWNQIAVNELFELPRLVPKDDPRQARWRASGAEALRRASLDPEAPPWLAAVAARELTESGRRELAIEHLRHVYAVTSDENAREQLRAKLAQLVGQRSAAEVEQEERRLRELRARHPYAPEAFSVIMGAPPPDAVDTATLAAPP
jgi:hypothetical protein